MVLSRRYNGTSRLQADRCSVAGRGVRAQVEWYKFMEVCNDARLQVERYKLMEAQKALQQKAQHQELGRQREEMVGALPPLAFFSAMSAACCSES